MATKTKAKKTTITPLDDRIVVKPDTADERTASGIYLPEAAQEKPQTGKVVAAGPGKLTDAGERGQALGQERRHRPLRQVRRLGSRHRRRRAQDHARVRIPRDH